MKIKNDYVTIKNGKTYEFKNTITNEYLELFSKSQYMEEYKLKNKDKKLNYVYINTDDNINIQENYKKYYNLINNQTFQYNLTGGVDNIDQNVFVDDEDWINVKITSKNDDINLTFNWNEFVLNIKDNIDVIYEIENLEINYIDKILYKDENNNLKEYNLQINKNKHLFCLQGIVINNEEDLFNILQMKFKIKKNKTLEFKIRISFIKSQKSNVVFKELSYDEYEYNKYIKGVIDLPKYYKYRLPLINSYYNSLNNRVDTYYTYNNISGYQKSDGGIFTNVISINELANKKILQLAFGNENQIYAYVDISNSNIIVQKDEELYIYRKDIISSDATFNGDGLIPVHLSPLGFEEDNKVYYAELYSAGFGYNPYIINEEYTLEKDIKIIEENNTTYSFILKKEVTSNNYPGNNMFPGNTKYPMLFIIVNNSFPNNNIYCSDNLFPTVGDYKNFIMKYQLFYFSESGDKIKVNKYYTMAFYSDKYGILTIKDKIQRM